MMASEVSTQLQSLVEGADKELTCAICLSRYNNPKLLPCLHSYCKGCLEDLAKKSRGEKKHITCPQCQEIHELPENDIDSFKTYFTINNLLELLRIHEVTAGNSEAAVILCESGLDEDDDPQPAFARCLTCSHYLCKSCLTIHQRQKITKGHDVITLTEIQQAEKKRGIRSLQKKQYCEEHEDEVVKLFCNACKKTICRDCALVKHKEHDFNLVRELRPEVQELLEKLMTAVQAKEAEFVSHKMYAENLRKLSESALATCTKEVGEVYEKLIAQLEAHRSTLISELNDIHKAESKQIDAEVSSLSLALVRLANSIRFTRQLLDNGDDLEVMSMSVQAQETLETLGKMTWDRETLKPTLLRMKFDSEVTNVKPFGRVLHEIQPDDIIVKELSTQAYLKKKLCFEIQLSSDISERGYKASPKSLLATVTQNGKLYPVTVQNLGVNCWTLRFIPKTRCLHVITIKCGSAMKIVEKDIQTKALITNEQSLSEAINKSAVSQSIPVQQGLVAMPNGSPKMKPRVQWEMGVSKKIKKGSKNG